jgi:DNA-binding beta-propeller fold protein YncE
MPLGALAACALIGVLLSACAGFEEPALQPVTTETLTRAVIPPATGKSASFDFMTLNQESHRLYIADDIDQGVDVMDVSSTRAVYMKTIPQLDLPNGIVYVPELQKVYVGLVNSTVAVIEANPASPRVDTVVKNIWTGGQGSADLLGYDPKDKRLFVTNPDDGFIGSIDAITGKLVGQIFNLGATEQPVFDPVDGMLYVADADSNSILQIDPVKLVRLHEYPLPDVCVPHGLALDPATNQGLIGCGDKDSLITMAWDFGAKRVFNTFDFAGGGDQVVFDAKSQHFYFAAQGFAPPEMAIFNADPITFLTAVPTSHHSLNVAYDETHEAIYTIDGLHLQAGLWQFPDPVAGCSGQEALMASQGAPRAETPHCHPGHQT